MKDNHCTASSIILNVPSDLAPTKANTKAKNTVDITVATIIYITLCVRVMVVNIDAWYIRGRASRYGAAVIDVR